MAEHVRKVPPVAKHLKNIYRLIFGAISKIHRCIFFKEGFCTFFEYFLLRIIYAKYTTKSFLLTEKIFWVFNLIYDFKDKSRLTNVEIHTFCT